MRPKVPKDLSLAPVAAEVDHNLQRIRDLPDADAINREIVLETNMSASNGSAEERRKQLLGYALRNVEMHGWDAAISEDGARLRLSGGSVSLDLGLSASLLRYLEGSNVPA